MADLIKEDENLEDTEDLAGLDELEAEVDTEVDEIDEDNSEESEGDAEDLGDFEEEYEEDYEDDGDVTYVDEDGNPISEEELEAMQSGDYEVQYVDDEDNDDEDEVDEDEDEIIDPKQIKPTGKVGALLKDNINTVIGLSVGSVVIIGIIVLASNLLSSIGEISDQEQTGVTPRIATGPTDEEKLKSSEIDQPSTIRLQRNVIVPQTRIRPLELNLVETNTPLRVIVNINRTNAYINRLEIEPKEYQQYVDIVKIQNQLSGNTCDDLVNINSFCEIDLILKDVEVDENVIFNNVSLVIEVRQPDEDKGEPGSGAGTINETIQKWNNITTKFPINATILKPVPSLIIEHNPEIIEFNNVPQNNTEVYRNLTITVRNRNAEIRNIRIRANDTEGTGSIGETAVLDIEADGRLCQKEHIVRTEGIGSRSRTCSIEIKWSPHLSKDKVIDYTLSFIYIELEERDHPHPPQVEVTDYVTVQVPIRGFLEEKHVAPAEIVASKDQLRFSEKSHRIRFNLENKGEANAVIEDISTFSSIIDGLKGFYIHPPITTNSCISRKDLVKFNNQIENISVKNVLKQDDTCLITVEWSNQRRIPGIDTGIGGGINDGSNNLGYSETDLNPELRNNFGINQSNQGQSLQPNLDGEMIISYSSQGQKEVKELKLRVLDNTKIITRRVISPQQIAERKRSLLVREYYERGHNGSRSNAGVIRIPLPQSFREKIIKKPVDPNPLRYTKNYSQHGMMEDYSTRPRELNYHITPNTIINATLNQSIQSGDQNQPVIATIEYDVKAAHGERVVIQKYSYINGTVSVDDSAGITNSSAAQGIVNTAINTAAQNPAQVNQALTQGNAGALGNQLANNITAAGLGAGGSSAGGFDPAIAKRKISINWESLIDPDGRLINIQGKVYTTDLEGKVGIPGELHEEKFRNFIKSLQPEIILSLFRIAIASSTIPTTITGEGTNRTTTTRGISPRDQQRDLAIERITSRVERLLTSIEAQNPPPILHVRKGTRFLLRPRGIIALKPLYGEDGEIPFPGEEPAVSQDQDNNEDENNPNNNITKRFPNIPDGPTISYTTSIPKTNREIYEEQLKDKNNPNTLPDPGPPPSSGGGGNVYEETNIDNSPQENSNTDELIPQYDPVQPDIVIRSGERPQIRGQGERSAEPVINDDTDDIPVWADPIE